MHVALDLYRLDKGKTDETRARMADGAIKQFSRSNPLNAACIKRHGKAWLGLTELHNLRGGRNRGGVF